MSIPIMTYSNDEKETVIVFDYVTNLYSIYTNVPGHITKCMKQYGNYNIKIISVHEIGKPSCIEVRDVPNAITFRSPLKRKPKKENVDMEVV